MPIFRRRDTSGPYYQYGWHGKKYYYTARDVVSRESAKEKAYRQMRAIHARS